MKKFRCLKPADCDDATGQCDNGCQPCWIGPFCDQTCPVGKFGPHGRHSCHCKDDACRHTDGTCFTTCLPGWIGRSCSLPCEEGWWGLECRQPCGGCSPSCHPQTGQCQGLCPLAKDGPRCETEREAQRSMPMIVGVSVGSSLGPGLLSAPLVCVYSKCKSRQQRVR